MRTPLAAKALTKARSKAAKKRGLPANLVKAIEARRQSKAQSIGENPRQKQAEVRKRHKLQAE